MPPSKRAAIPEFVRDERLPFVEARSIEDGRKVCYAKHTHETFSIGTITGGCSTYLNGRLRERVGPGSVVIINPEEVHACNPVGDQSWAYRMFYVDAEWLGRLALESDDRIDVSFSPFATLLSREPALYRGLNQLYIVLKSEANLLHKESVLHGFFARLHDTLYPAPRKLANTGLRVARAADYIRDNATRDLRLNDVCAAAELSTSYLIRAFKKHYGLTPHAYQLNYRIQYCRTRLRRGHRIAEVALDAGFADQAHLQREFKRLVAATPGQYRGRVPTHLHTSSI